MKEGEEGLLLCEVEGREVFEEERGRCCCLVNLVEMTRAESGYGVV
jgi:hypothetical protein